MNISKREKLEQLRLRAEAALSKNSAGNGMSCSDEMNSLVHELQVYQTELEMQNEELRQTQNDLLKSRDEFARLYNDAPVGYVTLDQNRVVVQANSTFTDMVHTPRKSSSDITFEMYVHPDDRNTFLSRYKAIFKKPEQKSLEVRLIGWDNSDVYVHMKGRVIENDVDGGNGQNELLLLSVSDITAEMESKRLLEESEHYYRTLVGSMHEDIFVIDRDFTIIDVNNTFLETLGVDKKEAIGSKCYKLSHGNEKPCDQCGEKCRVAEVFEKGEPVQVIHEHVKSDGSKIWVDIIVSPVFEDGSVSKVIESVRDITDIMEAEQAVMVSEKKYRTLFDSARDAIYIHGFTQEGKPGRFIDVNTSACHMLGYRKEELLSKSPSDIDEKCFLEKRAPRIVEQLFKTGTTLFEAKHVAKDGRQIPVEIGTHLIEMNGEQLALSTARDISERKKAEKREAHIKQVLLAIRNVNQLITTETQPDRLITKACKTLTETMGYNTAWIALIDESGAVATTANAGFNGRFKSMLKMHKHGKKPSCMNRSLKKDGIVVVKNTAEECPDCPLVKEYKNCSGFVRKLSFEDKIYGILSVSVPTVYVADAEEQDLFNEVADDLGFAFYKIEKAKALKFSTEIINSSPAVAFVWVNTEGWPVRFVSENVEHLWGYTADDFIEGHVSYAETVHPDDMERVAKEVAAATEDRSLNMVSHAPYRILTRSGDMRWIHDMTTIQRSEKGEIESYRGIVLDITERKHAEEKLRENEQYLSTILQTAVDGFWIIDNQGRLTEVNESYCGMTGYRRDELIGMTISQLDADETPEDIAEHTRRIIEQGSEIFETHHRRKDGSIFPVEVSTTFLEQRGGQFVCFCRDLTEKKQIFERLRRKSLALNQITDIVTMTDLDGNIIYVNDAAIRMLGKTRDEIIGQKTSSFGEDPMQGATQDEILEKTLEEGQWRGEVVNLDVHGNRYMLDCRTQVIVSEDGEPIALCGISTDVTERRQAELALQDALMRQEEAVRAGNVGLWDWNLVTNEVRFSKEWKQQIGYAEHEIRDDYKEWESRIHPDDLDFTINHIQRCIAESRQECHVEFRMRHKDGTYRTILAQASVIQDENGTPSRMLGSHIDITEQKKAQEALRESEKRYQELFEYSRDGFVFVDLDGQIIDANKAYCRMLGYTIEELRNLKNFNEITPERWHDWEREEIWDKRLLKVGYTGIYEKEYIRKDGTVFPVELQSYSITDDNGLPLYMWGIARNITERKQAEMDRDKARIQLDQAQKMEAVGRLAGGVAHDFNNMLGVIIGHMELALEKVDEKQPIYTDLVEVKKTALRSADLTRQLLAFARRQTVAPEILDLNNTIQAMFKMLHRLIGEDIDLVWKPAENLWAVKIDPAQVDQMLANLCINARDAIKDVGKITIETGNVVFDNAYCAGHKGFIPGEYVMLAVSDNGCGIDKENINNIFEPFFTTKGVGEGTGLGLATVYGIIKQNDGFVNVYSEQGHGTTFKLYLPRQNEPKKIQHKKKSKVIKTSVHETILLVEDEPAILQLGLRILENLGYKVIAAGKPTEAMELAKEHKGEIHLLITDVIMPEMNGRNLANRLKSMYPDIKCMFMSGYTANVIAHHGVLDEGVHFIQKPFSMNELSAKVQDVLNEE